MSDARLRHAFFSPKSIALIGASADELLYKDPEDRMVDVFRHSMDKWEDFAVFSFLMRTSSAAAILSSRSRSILFSSERIARLTLFFIS